MGQIRLKADPESPAGYYHCSSRIAFKKFIFKPPQLKQFMRIMRMYEKFCQVRVLTFCAMSNHVHALVMVPRRPDPAHLPSDRRLVFLVRKVSGDIKANTLAQRLKTLREEAQRYSPHGKEPNPKAESCVNREIDALRETVLRIMWDVSWFMRLVKQRFSIWFNKRTGNKGTIWSERFHSVLVEGRGRALGAMGAYVDLNPVRANMRKIPEDYLWSGLGQAVRGNRRAINGIAIIANALASQEGKRRRLHGRAALAYYRMYIYEIGRARNAAITPDGEEPGRAGIPEREVDKVLAAKGKMSLAQALYYELPHFTHGVAFGSEEYVEEVFKRNPEGFGALRTSGARPLSGIDAEGLYTMRNFHKNPIRKPEQVEKS